MAYCVFTNCLSILGSGITPYTSLDSRSGCALTTSVGQMAFFGSSDNSGPLGMVFQHFCQYGMCRVDITSTRYGVSGNDLSLNVDGSDPDNAGGIYIKYRGNVGIGTSSPSMKLTIQNKVDRAYTPNSFNDNLHALYINFCNQNQRAGLIRFTSHGNLENTFGVVQVGCAAAGCGQGDFVFQAYREAGGAAYNELMRLTNTGNVGINCSTPTNTLEVNGTGRFRNSVEIGVSTSSTSRFQLNFQNWNASNSYPYITFQNPAANCRHGIGINTSDNFVIGRVTGINCNFAHQDFVITNSTGNIGVGTSLPCNRLHVIGTDHYQLVVQDSNAVMKFGADDAIMMGIGMNANGFAEVHCDWFIGRHAPGSSGIKDAMYISRLGASSWGHFFVLNNCGNLGIGIENPGIYKLNVNGAFYAAGSSKEYKTSICEYNTDSCMFMKLKPVTYDYKEEWKHLGKELKSGTQIGLIAEDTAEVFPELAVLKDEEDQKVVRNVDYEKLSIVLLAEVQKLRKEVDDLKTK